jgi:dinuclear metal center YbgI/SA1388 family protein
MHRIADIINFLETLAPLHLEEEYDNSGLVCGDSSTAAQGAIAALDLTEEVIDEAIGHGFNLIIVHHPPIFKGLKKINAKDPVTSMLLRCIQHNIAIYAIHTNLDNVIWGVNGEIAARMGLKNLQVLSPKAGTHLQLNTYVPSAHAELVKNAIFEAGAGAIGLYNECSFSSLGEGTFKALEGANPFIGEKGLRHLEEEQKLEFIFPVHLRGQVLKALNAAHPYETVAYNIVPLENQFLELGAGAIGILQEPLAENDVLSMLKSIFKTGTIRHSPFTGKTIQTIALCGGSGKSLINNALGLNADLYFTGDLGYHDFFLPAGRMLLADIGHFESEQYTSDLLERVIKEKFPTFAVLKTGRYTNPVNYFL